MRIESIKQTDTGILFKVEADSAEEIELLRSKIGEIDDILSAECRYLNK
ncbi:MAG: hypothetical protein R6U26_02855 [Candidatus Undinarchaeales archaeon]